MTAGTPEELLVGLDASQQRAVTSPGKPLAIIAPAGSGKTRVLTRRIAWRVATEDAEPNHVLALTFTRKAARELRDRLTRLGFRGEVAAGTFNAVAYAQIRRHYADNLRTVPAILTRRTELLAEVMKSAKVSLSTAELSTEIDWAKARLLAPDSYEEGVAKARRRTPAPPERVATLYAMYESLKYRKGVLDFDDLLVRCIDVLGNDATFAAAQRWRFRHLFVDEFQDVNPLQLRLLDAWRGSHHDLCVVGDPQQAIYGWNGADPGLLLRFRELYRGAEVVELDSNYRSTPQILRAAAHVLRQAQQSPSDVTPTQSEGPPPQLSAHASDLDEARAVARAARDAHAPGAPWSAQAILVRTHAQIPLITEGLRDAGIPHRVRGQDDPLRRPDIRAVMDLLGQADRQRTLRECLPDLDALTGDFGPDDSGGSGLAEVLEMASDYLRMDDAASATGFRFWLLQTLRAEGLDDGSDAITVATFHAAKGLEWPVVHLAGLEDGLVPIGHARNPAARAEEARLLYVAMTRALRHLHCTWAATRSFKGKVLERHICPWLRGLPVSGPAKDPDWRDHLAAARRQLPDPAGT
jgi:DNA helicase II / ATP-dependent DNA helicase PcrA